MERGFHFGTDIFGIKWESIGRGSFKVTLLKSNKNLDRKEYI
jgi:hypothetical protein